MRPPPRSLDAVLRDAPGLRVRQRVGDGSVIVEGITMDSRAVHPGDVFCAVRGAVADGHDHAAAAVAAGAVALLVERVVDLAVPQVVVDDSRAATGPLAAAVWEHPARALRTVGVTGTNGKTTTTHLLAAVFEHAGLPAGVIGTLSGAHTTPEAPELHRRLAGMVADGRRAVAMEVSSHALALHRVDGLRFDVAVFTNLGRDHLDFHGTVERYFAAKARLFEPDLAVRAVVCVDDPHGRLLADVSEVPVTTYSVDDAGSLVVGPTSSTFRWRGHEVHLPLGGRFNVANALAAAETSRLLGLPDETVAAGLSSAPQVPGRFEAIVAGQAFAVVVDYAHTPDSLAEVLQTARHAAGDGRVLVVFGCGGDRDHTKRPAMGATAARLADVAVVTSDNPRSEDPAAIIAAVLSGVAPSPHAHVVVEPDRRAAIGTAFEMAAPGDVVVLAGKGHETTQTIGAEVRPFDDRVVARELLEALA
jgi:UDP-N-acetylmuramoyl-L-alanyl-D-glutamate--2,6-diaminopimelate ligase